MASRAPVLIDLMVTDPTRQLESTGLAAVHASQGLDRAEQAAIDLDQALARLGGGATAGGRSIGDLGAGLSALPGPLGTIGQLVGDAGDVFEKMANPIGLAVGALIAWSAAAVGVVAGSVAIVSASDELIERLDAVGRTEVISQSQRDQLEDARDAIESVGDAWSEAGLIVAAEVGPAVERGADIVIGATLQAAKAVEWLSERADLLRIALGVLGGPASIVLVDAIVGSGGIVDALEAEGKAYAESGAAARKAAEEAEKAADRKVAASDRAARAARSAGEIQIGSGLGAGFSSSEVLGAGMRAEIAAFGAASDRMAAGLSSMIGPVEAADAAYAAQVAQIQRDIQVTGDLTAGMILLSAAVDEHAQALAEARRVVLEQAAATVQGGLAAISGNLGGALGALGPVGGILGSAIELGPDTVEILDSRLSEIGDNIVQLPETLAKVLFTLLGAGSDNAGEGIGRFLGAVGGAIGGFLVAGPAGVVPGATLGSAAGGGIGNALAGGRTSRDPVDRAMRRQARAPSVTINGIVTSNVLRSLADEVRRQGGPRGLRTSLGVP